MLLSAFPTVLGQLELWRTEGPRPPRLTPGPSIVETFFEQPLLTAGVALFIGLVLYFLFSRGGNRKRALVAAALALAAAAGLYALGHFVETDREAARQRTRTLIGAIERADMAALEEMLAPNASGAFYGNTIVSSREALLERLGDALQSYPVASARISTMEAASRIKGAAQTRTRAVLRMPDATLYDIPTAAWFLIDWRTDDRGEWLATRIELEMVEDHPELANVRP